MDALSLEAVDWKHDANSAKASKASVLRRTEAMLGEVPCKLDRGMWAQATSERVGRTHSASLAEACVYKVIRNY